jgi:hypothetical protein
LPSPATLSHTCSECLCFGYVYPASTLSVCIRLTWGLKRQITHLMLDPAKLSTTLYHPASSPSSPRPPLPCALHHPPRYKDLAIALRTSMPLTLAELPIRDCHKGDPHSPDTTLRCAPGWEQRGLPTTFRVATLPNHTCSECLCFGYVYPAPTLSVCIRLTWGLKRQITHLMLDPAKLSTTFHHPASSPPSTALRGYLAEPCN